MLKQEKEEPVQLPITPDTPLNTLTAVLDHLNQMEKEKPGLRASAYQLRLDKDRIMGYEALQEFLLMQINFIDNAIADEEIKQFYSHYFRDSLKRVAKENKRYLKEYGEEEETLEFLQEKLAKDFADYSQSPLMDGGDPTDVKKSLQAQYDELNVRIQQLREEMQPHMVRHSERNEAWMAEKQQLLSSVQNYYRSQSSSFALSCLTGGIKGVKTQLNKGNSEKKLVNTPDPKGYYPLHLACRGGDLDVISILLKAKANPNLIAHAREGSYPIHEAVKRNQGKDSVAVLTLLKQHGANIQSIGMSGRTALHSAAYYGDINACEWLSQEGVDINAQESVLGETALHTAVAKGYEGVVSLLLEKRANHRLQNKNNETPLLSAVIQGRFHLIGVFMEHGIVLSDIEMEQLVEYAAKIKKEDLLDQYQKAYQSAMTAYLEKLSQLCETPFKVSPSVNSMAM